MARGLRRILHPTDLSAAARPAFRVALNLARGEAAELIVLHVLVPPSPFVGGQRAKRSWRALEAAARMSARRGLAVRLAQARGAKVRVRARLTPGIPVEEIVRAATAERADVVVIGTHGRSGLARALMGSVAAGVTARARCPVITVRARHR